MVNMNLQCQVAKRSAGLGAGFFSSLNYQSEEGEKSNIVSIKWKSLNIISNLGSLGLIWVVSVHFSSLLSKSSQLILEQVKDVTACRNIWENTCFPRNYSKVYYPQHTAYFYKQNYGFRFVVVTFLQDYLGCFHLSLLKRDHMMY